MHYFTEALKTKCSDTADPCQKGGHQNLGTELSKSEKPENERINSITLCPWVIKPKEETKKVSPKKAGKRQLWGLFEK